MRTREFMKVAPIVAVTALMVLSMTLLSGNGLARAADQVPGVTDDTITIGMFAPLTGPIALYGRITHMGDAIFQEMVNKAGGIHGRRIKTVLADTACEPVKGVAAVKKLIHQDKVFMLYGGTCSNVVLAAKEEILKERIPWMSAGAAAHGIYYPTEKNIFIPQITSVYVAYTIADFVMTKPDTKKIAVIKHTDEWAMSFYKPLISYLKEKYNVVPVSDVTIERGVTDATPQVLAIKRANPDFVFAVIYVEATSTFLRDAYKLGLDAPIIGTTAVGVDEQYNRVGIPEALKKFFTPYWFRYPLNSPEMDRWRNLLKKYYPKDEFDSFSGYSISGPLLIIEALKKVGRDLTREKIIQAFESFDNFTTDIYPMANPISFSPTDHIGMKRDSITTIATGKVEVIYQWKDYEKLVKGN